MNKRIVLIHGDKGGVGKSTFARLLAAYYQDHKLPWRGFDAGNRSGDLLRFYPEQTTSLSLRKMSNLDRITDAMDEDRSRVLVDLGPCRSEMLQEWLEEIDFFELKKTAGFNVTLVFLSAPATDNAAQWKPTVDFCGNRVDYVIVKNLTLAVTATRYNANQTPKYWKEPKAIEITLPILGCGSYQKVDALSLPWREAETTDRLHILDRSRVSGFLELAYTEIEKAKEYFL